MYILKFSASQNLKKIRGKVWRALYMYPKCIHLYVCVWIILYFFLYLYMCNINFKSVIRSESYNPMETGEKRFSTTLWKSQTIPGFNGVQPCAPFRGNPPSEEAFSDKINLQLSVGFLPSIVLSGLGNHFPSAATVAVAARLCWFRENRIHLPAHSSTESVSQSTS
jgi:hypothetical protein